MKVHHVFLTVARSFFTACDVDLYRSLRDEANQMLLALLMQHHIDAVEKKTGEGQCYLTCPSSRSLLILG